MTLTSEKTFYIWDKKLLRQCNKIPILRNRASMVHSLIKAYKLLPQLEIIPSKPASYRELCIFHGKSYVNFLRLANRKENLIGDKSEDQIDVFGLGYDCPVLYRMFNFARLIAGGSLRAAEELSAERTRRAINWCGGWHHAQKSEAQGFCYVNDIVLAIYKLLEKFSCVLYIDLDVHHGNGVEKAFESDGRVLTLSLHLHEPGFFPCSGGIDEVGKGPGQYYSVNVPLKAGLSDASLAKVFNKVSETALEAFNPKAVVIQCGADGLNKDPLGHFSLTLKGVGQCVEKVLAWNLPTLFLGGGGYNFPNAARLWAYLTALIVNKPIVNDIPEHKYFLDYGDGYSYELHIAPGQREDLNSPEYLQHVIKTITDNLQRIKQS